MDNSVHFFSNLELHVFIIREDEKKGRGVRSLPRKKTSPYTKLCAKVPSMTEFLIRGQGHVYMRYCYEAVVHSGVWLVFIPVCRGVGVFN